MARQDGLPPFLFDLCMDNEQLNACKTVCVVNQAYTHVLVIFSPCCVGLNLLSV